MQNPFEIKTSFKRPKTGRALDWEEAALDTQTELEDIFDPERTEPRVAKLWLLTGLIFLILGGRIFYLQIIHGSNYRALSDSNRVRSQSLLAPRGLILDRNNQILAQNVGSFNLMAVPFDLPKNPVDLEAEITKLSESLSLDKSVLVDKISAAKKNPLEPVILAQDVSQNQSVLFQTMASDFIGFSVKQIPAREYINSEVFSHVIGYTGLVGPNDIKPGDKIKYDTVDFIGKSGVEAFYESYLHGKNGQNLVEVDAAGKQLDALGENNPIPGSTLVLNIDKNLQEKLFDDLKKSGNARGAAVALNPKTGQVLALISLPGFDNNLFAHGIKSQEYTSLVQDKHLPLFNRAIAGTYPPGSTVKPMIASAGLEEKIISPDTVINDRGAISIPNQYDPSQQYVFRGWKPGGLGKLTVREAIAMSSDIFFYTVAGGYPNSAVPDGLGAQKLADYYRKFNVGKTWGIDLSGEKNGLVPDPAWKAEYYKKNPILSKWYLGDTYHLGIGQGDMLVTPLQVAEWTAIIANNGVGFRPQVVDKALDQAGREIFKNQPEIIIKKFLSDATLKIVQEGMRQTVLAGTAKPLMSLSITSAGKTGTSQFDGSNPNRTHAWFTAYAPYEDPQIVITVLVEAGGEGNAIAEPVVKNALEWWAENRYRK